MPREKAIKIRNINEEENSLLFLSDVMVDNQDHRLYRGISDRWSIVRAAYVLPRYALAVACTPARAMCGVSQAHWHWQANVDSFFLRNIDRENETRLLRNWLTSRAAHWIWDTRPVCGRTISGGLRWLLVLLDSLREIASFSVTKVISKCKPLTADTTIVSLSLQIVPQFIAFIQYYCFDRINWIPSKRVTLWIGETSKKPQGSICYQGPADIHT